MSNFVAVPERAPPHTPRDGLLAMASSICGAEAAPMHVKPELRRDAIALDLQCMQGERERDAICAFLEGSAAQVFIPIKEILSLCGVAVRAREHPRDGLAALGLIERWTTSRRASTCSSPINATGVAVLDEANWLAALGWRVTVLSADPHLRLQVRNCPARPRVMYVDLRSLLDVWNSPATIRTFTQGEFR